MGIEPARETHMGWRFRRSINFGPLRFNLGKRGIGTSFGVGPFRVGRSSTGSTYRSMRIPGTGISYRTDSAKGSGRGCALAFASGIALAAAAGGAMIVSLW